MISSTFKNKINHYKMSWDDNVMHRFNNAYCKRMINKAESYFYHAQERISELKDILNNMESIYNRHNY